LVLDQVVELAGRPRLGFRCSVNLTRSESEDLDGNYRDAVLVVSPKVHPATCLLNGLKAKQMHC